MVFALAEFSIILPFCVTVFSDKTESRISNLEYATQMVRKISFKIKSKHVEWIK